MEHELNGRTPLDNETLLLSLNPDLQISPDATAPFTRGSCKTDRKPYDLAVTAVLLRAHLLAPDHITLASNGVCDDWRPARDLVGALLGEHTHGNPLVLNTSAGPAAARKTAP